MAGQTIRFFNLTGGLNTEQGLYTLNSSGNRTESPEMKNIEYYKLSGLKVQDGNTLLGNLDSHTVIGGYEYHQGNYYYLVTGTNIGDIYIYDDEYKKFNKIFSFDKVCKRLVFANYSDGLVISNGEDNLVYYVKDREQEPQTNLYSINNSLSYTNKQYIVTRPKASTVDEMSYSSLGIGDRIYFYKANDGSDTRRFDTPFEIIEIQTVDDITKEQEKLIVSPIGEFDSSTFTGYARIKLSDISVIGEHLHNSDPNNTTTDVGRITGIALANYKGRLWVANSEGGIYYSELGNIHGWDIYYDAGVISESEEDKSLITALGIWSEYLVIHKKNSTYLLNATDTDSQNWEYKPYTESTCNNPYSFISNDRGYYLYSNKNQGIYPLLSRSVYNTTYMGKELSYKIRSCFNELDNTKLDQIFVAYDPVKQYMCFYMNMLDGNGYSNKCYIYSFLTQSWLYRELPQNVTIAFSCNNKIYIGTYEGDILEEFKGTTFNGENIPFTWTSPEYVWGGGTNKTTTKEVRFKLANEQNNNFLVESILDGHRTSQRKRTIRVASSGKTLVWDTGYNLEDKNAIGEELPVFRYKAKEKDDEVYYSLSPVGTVTTKIDIPMYKEPDCSDNPVNNQDITWTTSGTINNYTRTTYRESNVYGWQNQDLEYQAYKYDDFIAWVKKGDTTGKCLINLTTKTTKELEYMGFGGSQIATGQPTGYVYCRVSADFYNNYWNVPNAQGKAQLYVNNHWIEDTTKSNIKVLNTANPNGGGYAYNNQGRGTIIVLIQTGAAMWQSQIQDRASQYDTYKEVTKEVSNGRTDSTNAIERAYTKSGDDIVIKINDVNRTFTRNNSYDFGNPLDTPKYTDIEFPSAGDKVYQDSNLTTVYATIKSRDGSKLYLNDNDIVLYKNASYDSTKQVPVYWLDKQVTFERYDYDDGNYFKRTFVGEKYPDDDDPVWLANLTNTKFDEDLWSGVGYTTKRCILSNQYFETIQYRFYGDTDGTSLCLSGFEVDGIQITEVPH